VSFFRNLSISFSIKKKLGIFLAKYHKTLAKQFLGIAYLMNNKKEKNKKSFVYSNIMCIFAN